MKKAIWLLLAMVMVITTGCFKYSSGTRTGQLVKFSQKGILWNTWEGEMVLGGLKTKSNYNSEGNYSGSTSVANVFEFSLDASSEKSKGNYILNSRKDKL